VLSGFLAFPAKMKCRLNWLGRGMPISSGLQNAPFGINRIRCGSMPGKAWPRLLFFCAVQENANNGI
jgi:hypothetical protein